MVSLRMSAASEVSVAAPVVLPVADGEPGPISQMLEDIDLDDVLDRYNYISDPRREVKTTHKLFGDCN